MRSWSSRRSSLTDGVGSRTALIVAFGAVYLIWGSTYLAIRFAIETLPPFLMAGVRFTVAGGILYLWARLRGAERPGPVHWRSALIIGGLLLFIGKDRKSTRLNSSHVAISYAVFCLKKKKNKSNV